MRRILVAIIGLCAVLLPALAFPASLRAATPVLPRVRVSSDKTHFVLDGGTERFVVWGFNYDHDGTERLIEDYWAEEWGTVEADFREMKELGAKVIRIHLQVGQFMNDRATLNAENIDRLKKLVELSAKLGLYLDVTGLACYHKKKVPQWYDALGEVDRWEVQTRFWRGVAEACRGNAAVFCYDLMNEPIVSGGPQPKDWLPGEPFAGSHFVQRITTDAQGRDEKTIAQAWIAKLCAAIREVDSETLITVGVIPWAQTFKGAKPLFHDPVVGAPLDFVSIHLYPREGKLEEDLEAMRAYEVGKPLVIEEIFPLPAGYEATEGFIRGSRTHADGWISFYWGVTIEEYESRGDMGSGLVAGWLRRMRALGAEAGFGR